MAVNTQPYKGARDFYPEDKRIQKWLFAKWREVCERFGYEEYDAPVLEPLDLYRLKNQTNEEIVNEQVYSFTDRGDREVAIRPEMTPSVSRMVAGRRQDLAYPVRWFSIPNLWRYERPQRGRLREHWQLNVDIFGEAGLPADHEMILVADTIMQSFGAKRNTYSVRLNSRKFVDFMLGSHFKLDTVEAAIVRQLIDKKPKMQHADFVSKLDAAISPSQREAGVADQLLHVLEAKSIDDLPAEMQAHESLVSLRELLGLLDKDGIQNAVFDPTLMRGFDYYTDIVFEVFDADPENNRSMFGGGRYDGLVGMFGVEPVPTVGFGMGDVTLQNFLETHELLPEFAAETELAMLLIGDVYEASQPILKELRDESVRVYVDATGRKVEKQLKSAIKKGVPYALFVGDAELSSGQFTLKDLKSQEEQKLSVARVISTIKDIRH